MNKILIAALALSLLATASPKICEAQANDGYWPTDARVCADVTYQTQHFHGKIDRLNWPKRIKFDGLSWPAWKPMDPSPNFDLIRKAVYWKWARGNNSTWTIDQYYKAYGTPKQQDRMWANLGKPYYEKALAAGTLQMESTTVRFYPYDLSQGPSQAEIIRFRMEPPEGASYKPTVGYSGVPDQYQWLYIVKNLTGNEIINNTPIGDGPVMVLGELVVVGGELAIFDTHFPDFELLRIYFTPASWQPTEYTVMAAIDYCGN